MMNLRSGLLMLLLGASLLAGPAGELADHAEEIVSSACYLATAGDLRSIAMLLDYHYVRRGRYPASADFERWLESSFRPNQLKKLTVDHWGQEYIYRPGPDLRSFELLSRGPDGRPGSADDLRYVGP